jgi:hypothetical protein
MCDKLVFDLAQEVEGAPSVFVRKDWINILDNQNQSYVANQSVLDTSQLSNSNKYMSYREAYFSIPLLLTMASKGVTQLNTTSTQLFTPNTITSDASIGLKNWFGNIIHSFTVDYNGSTIIQQTPFINMWNSFKLMTSLSYNDVITQGCTIGFYPDNPETWEMIDSAYQDGNQIAPPPTVASTIITPITPANVTSNVINYYAGNGVVNNSNFKQLDNQLLLRFSRLQSGLGNEGFIQRQKWINFDIDGVATSNTTVYNALNAADTAPVVQYGQTSVGMPYSSLLSGGATALNNLYKSYISTKTDETADKCGVLQISVVATVYLKHIHSFFNMIPLLKGVFIKMTMNLNNSSCNVLVGANTVSPTVAAAPATANVNVSTKYQLCASANSAYGGVNLLQLASNYKNASLVLTGQTPQPAAGDPLYQSGLVQNTITGNGSGNLMPIDVLVAPGPRTAGDAVILEKTYLMNLSVGSRCLSQEINSLQGFAGEGKLSKSIFLYIPAYTFNPTFEQAYLSSPVKQIKYSDVYQYQVLKVEGVSGTFNNLLTNGIANVKSVLILPYYCPTLLGSTAVRGIQMSNNTRFLSGVPVWQSPFDPAGTGPTSPLCHFTNFNVQVSGQNAIYNLQKYNFEQFNNQLYGQNAVNGGCTDGLTSGLIDRHAFDLEYCYYYVNIERMLPVEQVVPKSIQIYGQNQSALAVDLYCFIEYGTEVAIDALTGARV